MTFNKNYVLIAVAVAALWYFLFYNKPEKLDNTKGIMYNFYADWCGYSTEFTPIWNKFAEAAEDVQCIDVNCNEDVKTKDPNINLCTTYKNKIPGFPSVLYVKPKHSPISYEGPRTVEGLLDFVKNN
jgi:thiol-disulfide isomerase/thioredoxin